MVRVVWGTFCLNQLNHWSQCRLFIVIMWVMKPWWLPVSLSKEWLMDLGVTWLSWGEKSGQPRPRHEVVPICGQPLANAVSFLEALTLQGLPAEPAPDAPAGSCISIFALAPWCLKSLISLCQGSRAYVCEQSCHGVFVKGSAQCQPWCHLKEPSPGCVLHDVTTKVPWLWQLFLLG